MKRVRIGSTIHRYILYWFLYTGLLLVVVACKVWTCHHGLVIVQRWCRLDEAGGILRVCPPHPRDGYELRDMISYSLSGMVIEVERLPRYRDNDQTATSVNPPEGTMWYKEPVNLLTVHHLLESAVVVHEQAFVAPSALYIQWCNQSNQLVHVASSSPFPCEAHPRVDGEGWEYAACFNDQLFASKDCGWAWCVPVAGIYTVIIVMTACIHWYRIYRPGPTHGADSLFYGHVSRKSTDL